MGPRELGALVTLGILWGPSFMWIKIAELELGPLAVATWRLLLGSLVISAVAAVLRTQFPRDWKSWTGLILVALLNPGGTFVLIAWGSQSVDSSVVAILNATGPLMTMILAHIFLADERISAKRALGLLAAFAGVALLVVRDNEPTMMAGSLIGMFAVLVAMICLSVSAVFVRRVMRHVQPLALALATMVIATGLAWASASILERPIYLPHQQSTRLAILWLGLLGSGIALILYFQLLSAVGATRTNLVAYITALVGVGLGVLVLGERNDWLLISGAGLVLLGIAIASQRSNEKARSS